MSVCYGKADTVDPNGVISVGQTEFVPLDQHVRLDAPHDRLLAEAEVMICLAGAIAGGRHSGRHAAPSDTDQRTIDAWTVAHGGGAVDQYRDWIAARTVILLDVRWPLVEAIETALLERRELTGLEVEAIAARFLPPRSP